MLSQLSNIRFRLELADIQSVIANLTPDDIDGYERLNGSGVGFGIGPQYAVQLSPDRLAQALLIADQVTRNDDGTLVFGDKFPRGLRLLLRLPAACLRGSAATVFGHQAQDCSALAEWQGPHDYLVR